METFNMNMALMSVDTGSCIKGFIQFPNQELIPYMPILFSMFNYNLTLNSVVKLTIVNTNVHCIINISNYRMNEKYALLKISNITPSLVKTKIKIYFEIINFD